MSPNSPLWLFFDSPRGFMGHPLWTLCLQSTRGYSAYLELYNLQLLWTVYSEWELFILQLWWTVYPDLELCNLQLLWSASPGWKLYTPQLLWIASVRELYTLQLLWTAWVRALDSSTFVDKFSRVREKGTIQPHPTTINQHQPASKSINQHLPIQRTCFNCIL